MDVEFQEVRVDHFLTKTKPYIHYPEFFSVPYDRFTNFDGSAVKQLTDMEV